MRDTVLRICSCMTEPWIFSTKNDVTAGSAGTVSGCCLFCSMTGMLSACGDSDGSQWMMTMLRSSRMEPEVQSRAAFPRGLILQCESCKIIADKKEIQHRQ